MFKIVQGFMTYFFLLLQECKTFRELVQAWDLVFMELSESSAKPFVSILVDLLMCIAIPATLSASALGCMLSVLTICSIISDSILLLVLKNFCYFQCADSTEE